MTTAETATKIVIVAGQEFSVPASTDNEAIRTHLASQGFADVASATIQTGKRKVGEQEVPTVEFVKKAGTKGMEGSELAGLIARVPAADPPKDPITGPTWEQALLLRQLVTGELTIGQAGQCADRFDAAFASLEPHDYVDMIGSRLCDRVVLHPIPAALDVCGW
jgi:hypothetical protein